ncbi:MAG TPA: PspA/IM30 family protein [Arenimonas sp.]|uniref:PspA/IM30 family protein n=1 Tax=Arenimonas sp. TaxID=1872635 RepID=UPI002D7E645C|nr:PspA/IM30 family protein [Arenimonas sp.]HEU0153936.1 PspA/IM30 family protein [Arenimonas sp.]
MKEAIGTRVGRLIAGSVNALIDAVENAAPEVVMEQALREIDGATDDVRVELGKVLATKHLANKRLLEENRKHEELGDQIELAVTQGREDLAEAAIARQFDIEAQLPVLEASITDAANQQKELEGYVAALAARRREMETELNQFRAAQKAAAAAGAAAGASGPGGKSPSRKVGEAENAFNRVMSRAGGVPGSAAMGADAAKLAELEDLSRKNRIQERLAEVKAKSGK